MDYKKFSKKLICCCLTVVLILGMGIPASFMKSTKTASAAWDGYVQNGDIPSSVSILNLNSIKSVIAAGAKPSKEYTKDGNMYSAHWYDHEKNDDFKINSFDPQVPTDWSNYSEITFKIYSKKATGAKMFMGIFNTNAPDGVRNLGTYFFVDWEGWKEITYKFDDLTITRGATLTDIKYLRIVANGDYKLVADPETDLYISSIKIGGYTTGTDFVNDFYKEEVIKNAYASLKDSVAVYADGVNIVDSEGPRTSTYSFGYVNGVTTVPVKLFADCFKADVKNDGKSYSVSLNGVTVSGIAESSEITVQQNVIQLSEPSYISDGMVYVPGEEFAKALGLDAFSDKKLLVIGTSDSVNALRRPGSLGVNEMNEIIAYKAYTNPVDITDFSAEDCKIVRDKWRKSLVGDEATNDITNKDIAKKINSITSEAKNVWKDLVKGNPAKEIFSTLNSTTSADMTTAYRNVESMALGFACYGGELYGNQELLADIIYALDWLYEHRYSEQGKANWKISGFDNWHDWGISTPEALVHTLLCIEGKVSPSDVSKYLSYFDKYYSKPSSTAANYCHYSEVILCSAMLQNDYEKAVKILTGLQKEYLYVDDNERTVESQLVARDFPVQTKGAGFFTDGSYVFHTLHAMNGAYGSSHLSAIMRIQQQIAGTKFDLSFPAKDNLYDFWLNSFDTVIFERTLFRAVMGRNENPQNSTSASTPLINAFRLAQMSDNENVKNEFYSIIKAAYLPSSDMFKTSFTGSLSIDEIQEFNRIMEDDSIKPRENRKSSRVFYNMDKTFHVRDGWAAGIAMSSSRMFNYESINGLNLDGWYLGDGRTEYYISGSDMNGTSQYWSSMDKYRMPGTTVDTQERKKVSVDQGNEYLSTKDFVGGVSLDNEYSASAMELESYHNDSDFGKDTAYGDPNPAHKNDLTAKKTYFMTDDGIICLGSAVNAKDNNNAEVLTIVDNPLAEKTVTVSDNTITPYTIVNAVASHTPEAENVAMNTIDESFSTKWAGESGNEIVWDLGEVKTLGFANISLLNGAKRLQYFELYVSEDGENWNLVFDGASSGKTETEEPFDLKGMQGRYVKYVNKGNSAGSVWVSITECKIFPPNPDGTIGTVLPEVYGEDPITVDGNVIELKNDDKTITGATWVNFNNKVGYYFPANVSPNSELKCRWSKNIMPHFELWFSHGVNPTDSGYAYVLLPGKTSAETSAFASKQNITVLSNTPDLQVAKDNRTGITYYVFWKAGTFGDIIVSKPCMVITRETETGFELSVSDPTQKLSKNTVTVNKALSVTEADEYATVTAEGSTTKILLNLENSVGRTYSFKFTK
ncbi:MAG: discoidin domain-containing protein [Clostridia bacterium]|nr:discoidin domain-containing protein [Clostridia bacterium]